MIGVEFGIGNTAGRYGRRPVAGLKHIVMIGDIASGLPDLVDLEDMVVRIGRLRRSGQLFEQRKATGVRCGR